MDRSTQVLLRLLAADRDDSLPQSLAPLRPIDWQAVVELADRHGVSPLLHRNLKALADPVDIPPAERDRLRARYVATAGDNLLRLEQFSEVVLALDAVGVPVIALKGIDLAERVYRNIAARPMTDIDILIADDHMHQAVSTLLERGYRCLHPGDERVLAASPDGRYRVEPGHKHFLDLVAPDGAGRLDLHSSLVAARSPFRIDVSKIWKEACNATIHGAEVRVLSPEHQLLYCGLHAGSHLFEQGLRAIADTAEIIEHHGQSLDWTEVVETARRWRAERGVYLTLRLTQELLASQVPDEALVSLQPAGIPDSVLSQAKRCVFLHETEAIQLVMANHLASSSAPYRLWQTQRWGDKVAVLLKGLFPSPATMARQYPPAAGSWRIYAWYPVRIKDVVSRHGATVWRLLRGDADALETGEQVARCEAFKMWLSGSEP